MSRGADLPPIVKFRKEAFGGIVFRERPGFVAYVSHGYERAFRDDPVDDALLTPAHFSAPLDAHMALTTACNLWCRGCYAVERGQTQQQMPVEQAGRILDVLARLRVLSVSFGGGEPTLHPHLLELARYARQREILPNLTTNGRTLTAQNAADFGVFGNVHLSLHAPEDWEPAEQAGRLYRAATGKRPGLNLLLTRQTLPLLEQMTRAAKRAGFGKILLLRYKTTAHNRAVDDLSADAQLQMLPEQLRQLSRRCRVRYLVDCSVFQSLAPALKLPERHYERMDTGGCRGGNAYIAIDAQGRYKPCSFWPETFGPVEELDFRSWRDNPQLQAFRAMRRCAACGDCRWLGLCGGGCRLPGIDCAQR